jgi:hypothetical protein
MNDDELRRLFEETRRHVDDTAADMRRHVEQTAIETRRHFDVSTEAFRHELRLLAESVDVKIID